MERGQLVRRPLQTSRVIIYMSTETKYFMKSSPLAIAVTDSSGFISLL